MWYARRRRHLPSPPFHAGRGNRFAFPSKFSGIWCLPRIAVPKHTTTMSDPPETLRYSFRHHRARIICFHRAVIIAIIHATSLATCLVAGPPSVHLGEPRLYVKEARFSQAVDEQTKICKGRFIAADSVQKFYSPSICLWTTLAGDTRALQYLQDSGKLPIKHIWIRRFYGKPLSSQDADPSQDTIQEDKIRLFRGRPVKISVGAIRDIVTLQWELISKKFFDWRTWSHRSDPISGIYDVKVCYKDGSPVTDGSKPFVFSVNYVCTNK